MADAGLYAEVRALIARESLALDRRRWQEWLDLFTDDVVYWVPAWRSEDELTDDPRTQLSLIYLDGRGGLEERVFRVESRDSVASLPLDRTTHLVSNVLIEAVRESGVDVSATWLVHSFGSRGTAIRGGRYEYTLRRVNGALKIARKKIVLIDEKLEGTVDVYHL